MSFHRAVTIFYYVLGLKIILWLYSRFMKLQFFNSFCSFNCFYLIMYFSWLPSLLSWTCHMSSNHGSQAGSGLICPCMRYYNLLILIEWIRIKNFWWIIWFYFSYKFFGYFYLFFCNAMNESQSRKNTLQLFKTGTHTILILYS